MSRSIAIHSDLREHGDQAEVYRDTVDLFALADRLGFDAGWVRSYHFRRKASGFSFPGGIPSPFPFLAAVAARTERIRLGTGVVPLPLENPVRVAEDAAVLDALSAGRFELGVSNGGQPVIADALGVPLETDRAAKKADYLHRLEVLQRALDGEPLGDTDQVVNPPAPGLSARIWEAALTAESGAEAALRGHGVLVGTTQTVPAEVTAARYHAALPAGATPRVGVVVHVHLAPSREAGLAALEPDLAAIYAWGGAFLPAAGTVAERATGANVHYGTPEQIAESLLASPVLPLATELQFAVAFGTTSHAERVDAVHALAESIAPAVGWAGAAVPA